MIAHFIVAAGLLAQEFGPGRWGCGSNCGTVATGDSRTVTEPVFPAVCSSIAATKFVVSTTAINIDPYNSTCGSTGGTFGTLQCTGGTSYEPSSTTPSYTAAETTDNAAVQAALNACASGKAVELIPGASGERSLVMAPFALPTGVSLIIDAGIYVFASRNLADYGGTNCGLITNGSSSCNHWITAAGTTGSGIYGYGTLNARGWDAYFGQTTAGFYANRLQAYCNARGMAAHGSPACTPGTGNNSFGPNAINLVGANNFTLYKVTIRDAGNFFVNWSGGNGFTGWGTKLIGPFEVSNTDGFDPEGSVNATFTRSVISNGDNQVAVKATNAPAGNITISINQTGAGIALAIGSATRNTVSNVIFSSNTQNGNLFNDQSAGIQIGSSGANGGLVNQVTFQNDCMINEQNSIRLYTNYGGGSGANTPVYQNIYLRNITVLPSTAPYTTGNSGFFTFQGLSGNPITAQIHNLSIQGINQGVAQQNGVTTDQYMNAYLGPGTVDPSVITQFAAGTAVTTTGSTATWTPYPCTTASWKPLIGELNVKTPASNNNQTYNNTASTSYTLQAVIEPATEISTKESPALTQPLTFLDNGVSIGNVALTGDGTYTFLVVSTHPSGTHVYTANYPGDTNYPSFTFGGVTVVNP